MAERRRRPIVAGLLSLAVPGAGQLFVGQRRKGLALLAASLAAAAGVIALGSWWEPAIDRRLVAAVLAFDLALLALRCYAVVDVVRAERASAVLVAARRRSRPCRTSQPATSPCAATTCSRTSSRTRSRATSCATAGSSSRRSPAAAALRRAGRLGAARSSSVSARARRAPLERSARVVTAAKPAAAKPWTTILLLGTDEGPGNSGRAPTRSSSSRSSTARAARPRSGSRATSPRCRSAGSGGSRRSR